VGFLERRIFTIAWTPGALIVLWCQIIAVGMPSVTIGSQRVILIGPAAVVLAVLPVDFLVMWVLIRRHTTTDTTFRGKVNRLIRFTGVATTGLLGSLLTVFVLMISANLTIEKPFLRQNRRFGAAAPFTWPYRKLLPNNVLLQRHFQSMPTLLARALAD
jgi:hypothetical protein